MISGFVKNLNVDSYPAADRCHSMHVKISVEHFVGESAMQEKEKGGNVECAELSGCGVKGEVKPQG